MKPAVGSTEESEKAARRSPSSSANVQHSLTHLCLRLAHNRRPSIIVAGALRSGHTVFPRCSREPHRPRPVGTMDRLPAGAGAASPLVDFGGGADTCSDIPVQMDNAQRDGARTRRSGGGVWPKEALLYLQTNLAKAFQPRPPGGGQLRKKVAQNEKIGVSSNLHVVT